MGSKQVRLDEAVYAKIEDRKRDDETFSDAVDRLIDDWSLAEFSTGMTDAEREQFQEARAAIEAKTAENTDDLLDLMDVDVE